jgi:hypothetical protein
MNQEAGRITPRAPSVQRTDLGTHGVTRPTRTSLVRPSLRGHQRLVAPEPTGAFWIGSNQ